MQTNSINSTLVSSVIRNIIRIGDLYSLSHILSWAMKATILMTFSIAPTLIAKCISPVIRYTMLAVMVVAITRHETAFRNDLEILLFRMSHQSNQRLHVRYIRE